MQERQTKYLREMRNIRLKLNIYFIDSKDERLPKYETLFKNLWGLLQESRENNTKTEKYAKINEIIRRLFIDMQVDQFDEYTKTCVAAHYAFILQDNPASEKPIPFRFLIFLLQLCSKTDINEHDVVRYISQYQAENDLSYKCDTFTIQQNESTLANISRCLKMLISFHHLLKFCTLQYTSVEEVEESWRETLDAYSAYKKDPLQLDFYNFFSGHSGHDMVATVGTTVDAQSVQEVLESFEFPQAVERIVLPLLSARKSKLTLEVPYDMYNACEMQQKWEALNMVLTQLKTAGGHAQDEGRRMLQERVKYYESGLYALVTKICKEHKQMQNIQVLLTKLNRLLESNTHPASSKKMPDFWASMKQGIYGIKGRKKPSKPKITQEAENDVEKYDTEYDTEHNTAERLLPLLRTFCTVTLDEKSIGALETLWHDIQQEYEKLNLLRRHVGSFFREKNADIPVSVDQVYYFMTSLTFEQAVKHIGLVKLVEARIRQPTQRQSTQLAQAVRCTECLHEQHAAQKELLAAQVATESESYTAVQNAVREQEARLNGALGQLYEDRQVLPRLLEQLKSLLQTHAQALTGATELA